VETAKFHTDTDHQNYRSKTPKMASTVMKRLKTNKMQPFYVKLVNFCRITAQPGPGPGGVCKNNKKRFHLPDI
jgi:hypothetical protein